MAVSYGDGRSRAVRGSSSSASFQRSLSPSGRFCSSSSVFLQTPSSSFMHRSSSPTRIKLCAISPRRSRPVRISSANVSVSRDRRSISVSPAENRSGDPQKKRTCMCSPTTHPGSFRCSLHRNAENGGGGGGFQRSNGLNARRSAMTNSLVRIGSVEGDLVRRALSALIRPSSHHQKRRAAFEPRPSRLSVMSKG